MNRRVLASVAVVLVALAALVATRTIDVGVFGHGSDTDASVGDAPASAEGDPLRDPRRAALEKGKAVAKKPVEPEAPAAPTMPSEAKGTAPERGGALLRGRVVYGEVHGAIARARVRLLRPDSLFHYLRVSPKGHHDELVVETDEAGRFAFHDVLPATGYAVLARSGDASGAAAVTRQHVDLAPRETLDLGDLVLGPAGGLGGHVTGLDGKPVAGARVAVTWLVKNEFGIVLSDPATLPWIEAETTTDAEGAWSCPALEPGDKTVAVKAPDGASDVRSPVACSEGQRKSDVDFALTGRLWIAGVVVRTDGAPIAGVRVAAAPGSRSATWAVETGADGTFRLGPLEEGAYRVAALVTGMPIRLLMARQAGDENVRFEFPYPGALVGKVVARSSGAPVREFRVRASYVDPQDFMASYVTNLIQKTASSTAVVSPDGSFRIEGLQPGAHKVIVEAEGFPPAESERVAVVAGRDVTVPPIELVEGHTISGVVVDGKGAPVAGASIYVVDAGEASWDTWDVEEYADQLRDAAVQPEGVTDDAGAFRTKPLSPRSFRVLVVADGWLGAQKTDVNVATRSVDGLRIALAQGGRIRVRAVSSTGAPTARAEVVAWNETGSRLSFVTGGDGSVDTGPIRSGRWIVAWHGRKAAEAGKAYWRDDGSTPEARFDRLRSLEGAREITVAAGETYEATVRVPRLVTVRGRTRLDPTVARQNRAYLATNADAGWLAIALDADGRFEAKGIEPGPLVVFYPIVGTTGDASFEALGPYEVPDADAFDVDVDVHAR